MFYKFLYASKNDLVKVLVLYLIAIVILIIGWFNRVETNDTEKVASAEDIKDSIIPLINPSKNKYAFKSFQVNKVNQVELMAFGLTEKEAKMYLNFKQRITYYENKGQISQLYIKSNLKDSLIKYAIFDPIKTNVKTKELFNEEITVPKATKKQIFHWDINKVSKDSLKKIKGIGNILSDRIVLYGQALGGYVDVDQLKEVYHYPVENHGEIASNLYVADNYNCKKINVNTISFKELLAHPYLGYEQVKLIFNEKDKNGDYKSWGEFKKRVLMENETYVKLAPYLKFKE